MTPRKHPRRIRAQKKVIQKILIIDDERNICWLLADILKDKGYEVGTAYTAKEGVALARQFKPDMIFLDLRLPNRTGIEILKPLRQL